MEIGEKLRNLRIQKNLTQEELGERTDLSKGYISQLERDLSSPSMETFFSILRCDSRRIFSSRSSESASGLFKRRSYGLFR